MEKNYNKLAVTLVFSFLIMYAVMFLNVNAIDHIYVNITRIYMTLLMISAMAILMLYRMPMMYTNKKKNRIITVVALLVFFLSFFGVHNQIGVSDIQYMRGMIPHHSIAIMTSENADIKDPRVRKLADGIIKTQVKEIAEMKSLIDSLK